MESSRLVPHQRCSHAFFLLAILSFLGSLHGLLHTAAAGQLLPVDDQEGYREEAYDRDRPLLYVVFVLPPEHGMLSSPEELEAWHKSFLPTPSLDSGKPRLVHSYNKAISGFAAWLTPREAEAMQEMEGFVDAKPDEPLDVETSHTPKFLRLENGTGLWRHTRWGAERLIGVIDHNIDPDHISFTGAGMRPSSQWKGTCDFKCRFPAKCNCTSKLLGATTFNKPKGQDNAHGTMVASVAAGDFVADAGFRNYAKGIASGAAPKAYLSFYGGWSTANLIAAVDRAIADGVNVLCISLTLDYSAYHRNELALSTLAAVEHGILVAMAAGNDGPNRATVCNDAPWLLTVGASTHDRAPVLKFTLIDRAQKRYPFYGVTQYQLDSIFTATKPVVYPGGGGGRNDVRTCDNTLGGTVATGAIVLCWKDAAVTPFVQAETVKRAGGLAMVLMNDQATGDDLSVVPYLHIPTVSMGHSDSNAIVTQYAKSKAQGAVKAFFWPSNSRFGVRPCPVVASFSSRGPGEVTRGVLKPDILGPGVSILGAKANTRDEFVVESGTSFATPHLAAVAAILKSRHPGWSPAAIRSAIMTTANITDRDGRRITNHTGVEASLYDTGAGLVNPDKADNPGLVYDISDTTDYLRVLCTLYNQAQVNKYARMGRNVDCATLGRLDPEQLNYPSIAVTLKNAGPKEIHRTVTNVGPAMSVYNYAVERVPPEVRVTVTPARLSFTRQRQQASFMLEAELVGMLPSGMVVDAYLKWTSVNGRHVVRSPLAIIIP